MSWTNPLVRSAKSRSTSFRPMAAIRRQSGSRRRSPSSAPASPRSGPRRAASGRCPQRSGNRPLSQGYFLKSLTGRHPRQGPAGLCFCADSVETLISRAPRCESLRIRVPIAGVRGGDAFLLGIVGRRLAVDARPAGRCGDGRRPGPGARRRRLAQHGRGRGEASAPRLRPGARRPARPRRHPIFAQPSGRGDLCRMVESHRPADHRGLARDLRRRQRKGFRGRADAGPHQVRHDDRDRQRHRFRSPAFPDAGFQDGAAGDRRLGRRLQRLWHAHPQRARRGRGGWNYDQRAAGDE